jgi:hypothetical protein
LPEHAANMAMPALQRRRVEIFLAFMMNRSFLRGYSSAPNR